ncbi:MAG TPA: arsenosugar biosynthesis radical SAM (seleno)protein ArsS [Terriglobia bacterium]|nr:arsenosugar biosynthesis radical SAM (seleno)protein ArsS [Terriglobia bacterium]
MNAFDAKLTEAGLSPLRAAAIDTLQVNVGKLCNQTCRHCHVDAGPTRKEIMTRETAELVAGILKRHDILNVDITGGAPELNPNFEFLVTEARALGRHVIDRCNLTVFSVEGKDYLPEFLRAHQVEITASLPCYLESNVEAQRGKGVYAKSVAALQWLNRLGYGLPETGLALNLVYNPVGPALPPDQVKLEADYKRELGSRFGIVFNRLYTITNMPISRFLTDLVRHGNYDGYMELLAQEFNPHTVESLMCRNLVSVGWDGTLYDCDFNQMLNMPVNHGTPAHLKDFDAFLLARREIRTGLHCFGCTAGSGSSCGGTIA